MEFTRQIFSETARMLRRWYRQSEHHQVRQRSHCILLRSQGYTIEQLMEILQVSRKTVYNWFNHWEERGLVGLYHRPGQGRKPTFNADQMEQIRAWATEHPKPLQQVVQKVQETWQVKTSTQTIKRVLKSLRMSWHRCRRVVGGQPDPQEYRDKQAEWVNLQQLEA